MSDKDLVYFKQGIPAGQQMDKYSNNPGCLFSKNADIFSSSNSYKATAFTVGDAQASGIVDMDDKGRIILKSNGDVVDTANNNQVIVNVITNFTGLAFPVNYNGRSSSTSTYTTATFGTLKKLIVKYEGDDYKEIVVYSDRMKYVYSTEDFEKAPYVDVSGSNCTAALDSNGNIKITNATSKNFWIDLNVDAIGFYNSRIRVDYWTAGSGTLEMTQARLCKPYLYYDRQPDAMEFLYLIDTVDIPFEAPSPRQQDEMINLDTAIFHQTGLGSNQRIIELKFKITTTDTVNASNPRGGEIMIFKHNYHHEYYAYLPLDADRMIKDIGEYYFITSKTFPSLYYFTSNWAERETTYYNTYQNVPIYDFTQYMGWEIDPAMTPIDCVVFDEKVYLICNQDGNGYIFPCDLSGGKGTPYIAYGVEFKSAIVLNYLIYLVGENRGVSTLFVYSGTELVHIIEGNKKADGLPDYIDNDEQYKFNGMIADWRGLLVLGTTDNRIFCYGQTFGGRGGSFIHSLASGQTLNEIKTVGKDLYIKYTEGGVVKTIKYQNDVAIKNYNTDFEIVYPVIIGSHIIEKEVYDLVCSYILPSSDCSLEFWLAVNHYYFWTFRLPSKPTIAVGDEYFLSGATGTNVGLTFVEKDSENGEWYTFRLSKNLPIQNSYLTANMKLYKPVEGGSNIEVAYTEFNHFKKIGEITADGYKEGYDRFNNINTKNGFPRTHSLQLMVKGHGTANYTPEVFGVNLVSNQRDRG